MACRQFGAKLLSQSVLDNVNLTRKVFNEIRIKYNNFQRKKCIWKCGLQMAVILSRPPCVKWKPLLMLSGQRFINGSVRKWFILVTAILGTHSEWHNSMRAPQSQCEASCCPGRVFVYLLPWWMNYAYDINTNANHLLPTMCGNMWHLRHVMQSLHPVSPTY